MRYRGKLAVGAIIVIAVLAVLVAPSLYEVQGHGRGLLPYGSGPVYELRVADSFTLYVDEESRPKIDAFTGTILAVLATAALMTFLLLTAARARPRLLRFYALAAAALAFLSLDEFLAFHETAGHNLRFLAGLLPGDGHPDDVIVLLYGIPALAFLFHFRDVLLDSRPVRLLVSGAVGCFTLAVVSDPAHLPAEEFAELATGACLVGALVLLMARHLADGLGLAWPGPAGAQALRTSGHLVGERRVRERRAARRGPAGDHAPERRVRERRVPRREPAANHP